VKDISIDKKNPRNTGTITRKTRVLLARSYKIIPFISKGISLYSSYWLDVGEKILFLISL